MTAETCWDRSNKSNNADMITYQHGFHKGGDFVLSKKNFSYIKDPDARFFSLKLLLNHAGTVIIILIMQKL